MKSFWVMDKGFWMKDFQNLSKLDICTPPFISTIVL